MIYLILMFTVPETPYFYILRRNLDAAQKSLLWFRGAQYDSTPEIVAMKRSVEDVCFTSYSVIWYNVL